MGDEIPRARREEQEQEVGERGYDAREPAEALQRQDGKCKEVG